VLLLTGVFGVLFVALTELTGTFLVFYKNPYFVNSKTAITTVLPIALLIVGSELLRVRIVTQKKNRVASIAIFVACVAAEVLAFGSLSGIGSINRAMDLIGMTLIPAITGGVLYHFVAKRYGAAPNIVYRVLTSLYIYFIKNTTALSEALVACAKILLPLGILALLIALYEKRQKTVRGRGSKIASSLITWVLLVVTVATAMLVSCQFRFGALVIATDSMTGEINVGDVIVYERYDGEPLAVGDVIVFQRSSIKVVHRVIEIDYEDGEYRYVTKGDYNEVRDAGYVTEKDIIGTTNVKLPGVGYPALWLNHIIENSRKEVT
jgi:signal peptidase